MRGAGYNETVAGSSVAAQVVAVQKAVATDGADASVELKLGPVRGAGHNETAVWQVAVPSSSAA